MSVASWGFGFVNCNYYGLSISLLKDWWSIRILLSISVVESLGFKYLGRQNGDKQ